MQFLKKHWRLIFPVLIMVAIFLFSNDPPSASDAKSLFFADFLQLPNGLTRKLAHFTIFAFLGASWYNYMRKHGGFTPGFTVFSSIALTAFYALSDEFHQTFIPGRSGQFSDIALDSIAGVFGVSVFAIIYYLTRSPAQKLARKEQVAQLWQQNQQILQKTQAKRPWILRRKKPNLEKAPKKPKLS